MNLSLIRPLSCYFFASIALGAASTTAESSQPNVRYLDSGQAAPTTTVALSKKAFAPSDEVTLYWLGMAGFLINNQGTTMMIDPLLEGFDMEVIIDFPIQASQVELLDAILITHSDNDHFSLPTLKNLAKTGAVSHATQYTHSLIQAQGLASIGHDIGADFSVGDNTKVTVMPVDHAWQNSYPDAAEREFKLEDSAGFWITTSQGTIWATGDSRLMAEQLTYAPKPDVILFDFSDSEWHFTLAGAVKLANHYPNAQLLLHHWGSVDAPDFAPFNGDPNDLFGLIDNPERIHVLLPGEPFTLSAQPTNHSNTPSQ
ncbi:MBL fold metallo-hydrolase [Halioxenophilus aromaticivorans]